MWQDAPVMSNTRISGAPKAGGRVSIARQEYRVCITLRGWSSAWQSGIKKGAQWFARLLLFLATLGIGKSFQRSNPMYLLSSNDQE